MVKWDLTCPPPAPRVFASAAADPNPDNNDVYLFGGTDGIENYGDLWIFRGHIGRLLSDNLRWERAVAVGPNPAPRYGHSMVTIGDGRLVVLGGCMVSPQSEVGSLNHKCIHHLDLPCQSISSHSSLHLTPSKPLPLQGGEGE